MSVKEFVRRSEIKSRESIKRAYIDLDMCYAELDLLNEQQAKYSNMFAFRGGLPPYEKQRRLQEIRERIPKVYEYINYFKECIAYEKREINRICATYGFEPNKKYNRDFSERIPNTIFDTEDTNNQYDYNYNNNEYNEVESVYSEVSQIEEPEELEEDEEEYKFNPETGAFE